MSSFFSIVPVESGRKGQSWIRHVAPSIQLLHSPPSGEMNTASNKLKEYSDSSFILPGAINEAVFGFSSPQQSQMKAHSEVQISLPPPIYTALTLPAAKKPHSARVPWKQQHITPVARCTANAQELNDGRSAHLAPNRGTSFKSYETAQKSRGLFLCLLASEPPECNRSCAGLLSEGWNTLLSIKGQDRQYPLLWQPGTLRKSQISRA